MFERITGFFRRFRSKRSTSETAMLGPDAGALDEFGLDDADFGDAIGTEELGAETLADEGFGMEADGGTFGSAGGTEDAFDSGGGAAESLSEIDTFETMSQQGLEGPGGGSLAGGSGEGLLDDSEAQAETFESLGGFDSGPSDADDFGDDLGGLDAGFGDAATAGALDEELVEVDIPKAEPARLRLPVLAGALVVGLLLGAGGGVMLMPMLTGTANEIPLDQQLAKVQSDLRKAERDLATYNSLGGLGAIEQLRVDLADSRARFASLEELATAQEEAQAREQAYDAVVQETREGDRLRVQYDREREVVIEQIADGEVAILQQRPVMAAALLEYQRRRQAMEASAVVAGAYDAASLRYARDRTGQMLRRPSPQTTAGE